LAQPGSLANSVGVNRALRAAASGGVGAGTAAGAVGGLGAGAAGAETTIGRVAQPPRIIAIASTNNPTACARPQRRLNCGAMWVIYLEAFAVAALMVFFVWWTMRGKK
jgi:hypothetical protein